MIHLRFPKKATLDAFIIREQNLPFTYTTVGATLQDKTVSGFNNDDNSVLLGQGEAVFQKAVTGLFAWAMFPTHWARIKPDDATIAVGVTVVMVARVMGFWWSNTCRIVGLVQEPNHIGFAYGTLPGHVECGEERFSIRMDEAGAVFYQIRAFSKPRHWLARLAYPIARASQRRFVRDSKAAMQQYVTN